MAVGEPWLTHTYDACANRVELRYIGELDSEYICGCGKCPTPPPPPPTAEQLQAELDRRLFAMPDDAWHSDMERTQAECEHLHVGVADFGLPRCMNCGKKLSGDPRPIETENIGLSVWWAVPICLPLLGLISFLCWMVLRG